MKTNNWIYAAIGSYLLFVLIMFIAAFRYNKKKIDEIKDKMDGKLLGHDSIPEEENDFQLCERPFLGIYENYN